MTSALQPWAQRLLPCATAVASGCLKQSRRVGRHQKSSERGDVMRKLTGGVVGLAVLVLGAGLAPSLALAKCPKDCKVQIRTEFKTCKSACTQGDKICKQACKTTRKAESMACTTGANPTPPTCSPSGAFLP